MIAAVDSVEEIVDACIAHVQTRWKQLSSGFNVKPKIGDIVNDSIDKKFLLETPTHIAPMCGHGWFSINVALCVSFSHGIVFHCIVFLFLYQWIGKCL